MRILLACLLVAHGLVHLVGFLGARTTVAANRVELGASWLWLAGTIGFGIAAVGALAGAGWWPAMAMGLAGGSLTLCVLQLPATRFGVVINISLIAALIGGHRVGWF